MSFRALITSAAAFSILVIGSTSVLLSHSRNATPEEQPSPEVAANSFSMSASKLIAAQPAAAQAGSSRNRQGELQNEIAARAEAMLQPSDRSAEQDRWLKDKSRSLRSAEAVELSRLALAQTSPYPARFLAVTLIAGSELPERAALLANIASYPMPDLPVREAHLSRARSHEHIVRKIAIDSIARSPGALAVLQKIESRQTDSRLRNYARRSERLVAAGRIQEARQKEDAVLARIANGDAQ